MVEPKFSFILLTIIFLETAVSGKLLVEQTNKLQLLNEVRGYLEVVLEILETSRSEKLALSEQELLNHSLELKVCMASFDSSEMVLNECQLTSLKDQKVLSLL